jgi:MFS family permease
MLNTPANDHAPTTQHLPRAVWLLSWVSFFADVSGEMVYPLLPLFLVGVLGASKVELGLVEGAAVLIVAVMTAFAGFRSDRSGKRVRWIRIGYGLPMLGKAMIALATAWGFVLGGRLLDRFGKGLRSAPRDAMIAGAVGADQRGRAFGVHRALDTAGALIGVLLSALLLWWLTGTPAKPPSAGAAEVAATTAQVGATPAWVYRAIFGVAAALGLASFLLTFLVREEESPQAEPSTARPRSDESRAGAAAPASIPGPLGLPRSYWAVLGVLVLFSLANSSDTFILLRASDLGFSPWMVVMVYALFNVTYAALSYAAGALSDRLGGGARGSRGRWIVIAAGWVIYAGVYAGFALLPKAHAWGFWPLMALYGVYMALTDGVGKALIADHAPRERRGAAMGLFYALTGLTTLVASLVAGLLWDRAGPAAAFLFGSAFAVLALAALGALVLVERARAGNADAT